MNKGRGEIFQEQSLLCITEVRFLEILSKHI